VRVLQRVRRRFEAGALDEMMRRIDHLARLGTSIITISGGEPLLHPDLDEIVARIRTTGGWRDDHEWVSADAGAD